MATREMNIEKIYNFPKEISIIKYNNLNLVVNTNECNWLVFSEEELAVFELLRAGNSIGSVAEKSEEDILVATLIQIEAKNFENQKKDVKQELGLFIYLTNNCNLRCKHCYMYSGDFNIDELDIDVWKRFLAEFNALGGENVTFSGGEGSLYKDFIDLLKFSHSLGLKNIVLSNGLLWNEQLIHFSAKFIDEIQISMDGYDEKSYKKIRGFDGFNKVMKNIKLFSSLGTRVSMAVTPVLESIDEFILNFKKFAINFSKENPNIFIKLSVELLNGRDINVTAEENTIYRNKLKALINELYPDYYIKNFVLNYENKSKVSNCGYGGITVSPNGDIYWCNRIHELKSTMNIKTNTLSEILEKSEEIKKATDVMNVLECLSCPIKFICGGGCRMDYKSLDTDNLLINNCTKAHKENLYKKMIGSNEYFYED